MSRRLLSRFWLQMMSPEQNGCWFSGFAFVQLKEVSVSVLFALLKCYFYLSLKASPKTAPACCDHGSEIPRACPAVTLSSLSVLKILHSFRYIFFATFSCCLIWSIGILPLLLLLRCPVAAAAAAAAVAVSVLTVQITTCSVVMLPTYETHECFERRVYVD